MKLTITSYTDKKKLIKFLRNPNFRYLRAGDSLQTSLNLVKNLPITFSFNNLEDIMRIKEIHKEIKDYTTSFVENDLGQIHDLSKDYRNNSTWFHILEKRYEKNVDNMLKELKKIIKVAEICG